MKNIAAGEDIVLKSDGSGKRTFCYITDAVAGYFKILFDGAEGEAYNVCNTSQFVSIRELAECLTEIYPEKNLHVICKQRSESENYTENKARLDMLETNKHEKRGSEGVFSYVEEPLSNVSRFMACINRDLC